MQIAEERRFKEYRKDRVLDVRQIDVALRGLRRLGKEGVADELDLEDPITLEATRYHRAFEAQQEHRSCRILAPAPRARVCRPGAAGPPGGTLSMRNLGFAPLALHVQRRPTQSWREPWGLGER